MVRERRIFVTDIPEPVTQALRNDQPERPINDLCCEILAQRYGLPFIPSGRLGRNWRSSNSLVLKIPEAVWVAVKREATPYSTVRQVAIDAFAAYYGINQGEEHE